MTPEDAEATTTLLRAPAAVVAAAFLVGTIAGEAVWSYRAPEVAGLAALQSLAVGLVCVPFLLASRRYRPGQTGMRAWMLAAAIVASLRTAYLSLSLSPVQPLGNWLMAAALQVALVGTLWLAVSALRRTVNGEP